MKKCMVVLRPDSMHLNFSSNLAVIKSLEAGARMNHPVEILHPDKGIEP